MITLNKTWDVIRLALKSLLRHKVRSVLTALGIILGVCSVIAMLAISEGASYESQLALRKLGTDNIIVRSIKPPTQDKASGATRGALVYGLTRKDVALGRDNVAGVRRVVGVRRTAERARAGSRSEPVAVVATEPAHIKVARATIRDGRFITHVDILSSRPYCVVTSTLARKLFDYEDPMGQTLRLRGEPFRVVGVVDHFPSKLAGPSAESGNYVFVPISTDRRRFGELWVSRQQGSFQAEKVEFSMLIFQMRDERAVVQGAATLNSILARTHEAEDYEVEVPYLLLQQKKEQARIWNFVFLAIALVSLLVGGIGIMNIMLASVTERTREIGIRRALGAKRRDITVQFLVESLSLATVGGLIGIGVGVLVPWSVQRILGFTTIITGTTMTLPLVTATIVGLLSGLYPALRAARLDPIVALRHE